MQKYKTFILLIILTALWSSIFSTIKYFIWGNSGLSLSIDLQEISGYLSLGGALAYIIGGALAYTFLKRYLLFCFSFFTLIFVTIAYLFPLDSKLGLAFIVCGVGLFYGLWVVLRSILTSIEIQKTGLADTKVNGIISIVFIVFLIIGTIGGSLLFENFGHSGFLVIIGLLIISSILSLYLQYDKTSLATLLKNGFKNYRLEKTSTFKVALKNFFPELKFIFKNFSIIIISSGFIWSVSTVVSQKAVEYSVDTFGKNPSEAGFLLLYSSVGAILGNIVSGFLSKYRWKSFFVLNILLGMLIIAFPMFNATFFQVGIIAFLIGFVFGSSTNLIDAYYLKQIGEQDKKEYGSSTYGLVFSVIIFAMMFISSFLDNLLGFDMLMYILGTLILLINILNIKKVLGK
ncbi:hypothetical protein LR004_00245 [Candidatus Gracilibacteria bacterium]|nr:hypothetical protein [Candidatus Gracilibacteria bacterium]